MDRTTTRKPIAPQTPAEDDEDELNDDLDMKSESKEPEYETIVKEEWIHVNDKAPIWMRCALPS
jgi:hypothetical protein